MYCINDMIYTFRSNFDEPGPNEVVCEIAVAHNELP